MNIVQQHFGQHFGHPNFETRHSAPRDQPGQQHRVDGAYNPPSNGFGDMAYTRISDLHFGPKNMGSTSFLYYNAVTHRYCDGSPKDQLRHKWPDQRPYPTP